MARSLEELILLHRTALRYLFVRESKLLSLSKKPVNKKIANFIKTNQENDVLTTFLDTLNEDLTRNINVFQMRSAGEEKKQHLKRREFRLNSASRNVLMQCKMVFRGGRMSEPPVVKVEQGELHGLIVNSPSGKAFYSFQGIPYAKPPVGSLRFKAPEPPESWEGVRDATSEGNMTAQVDSNGDENCLYLNVYTPNLDGEFLPVMVFIYGGGFFFGPSNLSFYGGDYLVEKDVVVVTINYRCGPEGFLCLNTPEVPGNAGLKDMVQAIRWVKQNIGNFGGNSGNITVFGESSGGVAASILAASPLTKNLIKKVIVQSGTALNSWAFQKHPIDNARKLAAALGYESNDINEIQEFLSTTPARDIVQAYSKYNRLEEEFPFKGEFAFGPVVEKEFTGVESVLTEVFIDILNSGRFADIPIMIGANELEVLDEQSCDDLQIYIPAELHIERNGDDSLAIAAAIRMLYFKEKPPNGDESTKERRELLSDVLINIDTHRFIQYLVKTTNKPIYFYNFDYVGELNMSKYVAKPFGVRHATHCDELGYLFKNDCQKSLEPTPQDVKIRERMLRLWTNFAKSGNPTPEENHYINVTWLPVTKDTQYCLKIGEELSLITNPKKVKMDFWEELYLKHYKIWDHPKTIVQEEKRFEEIQAFTDTTPIIVEETVIQTVTNVVEDFGTDTQVEDVQEFHDNDVVDEPTQEEANEVNTLPEVSIVPEGVHVQKAVEKEHVAKETVENHFNGNFERKPRPSNEIKMVQNSNGHPKDVIRANDPPEDDLPKNIGVNKFVNFFESLGGKK